MDLKKWMLVSLVIVGGATFLASADEPSMEEMRQEVVRLCTGCHGCDFYITPRSEKAWELTVSRMNDYAKNSIGEFTEVQSARLVSYLSSYFGEDSTLEAKTHFDLSTHPHGGQAQPAAAVMGQGRNTTSAAPVEVAAPVVTPSPAESVAPHPHQVKRELPPAIRERLAHPRWKPTRAVKRVAELGGYLAVFCSFAMFITGHSRMRLKRRFRPIHVSCALGLFVGLAAHAIIYLFQYGTPSVLWYWFGFVSFAVLVLAEFQGLIRKRFGPVFLKIHVTAGYMGFTLAILHWIWAWL